MAKTPKGSPTKQSQLGNVEVRESKSDAQCSKVVDVEQGQDRICGNSAVICIMEPTEIFYSCKVHARGTWLEMAGVE